MSRVKTKYTGVYYRVSSSNEKSDKTYYITYKDNSNKTKELKIGKYSEGIREIYCHQKRNEFITKIRLGEEPPIIAKKKKLNIVTINTLAIPYFEQRKETRSKQTDLSSFNKYISTFFKNKNINTLSKSDILNFTSYLKKCKNQHNNLIAPKTINNILNFLKTLVKFGIKNDLIKNDISRYIKLEDIDNARERFLTKKEIELLYKNSKDDDILFLIYKLALNTGARLSTILNISKKDIDFTHNLITLKDFKNNTTYKGFLNSELKLLLLKKTNSLKLNEKVFRSNPQRRLREKLNTLFNKGIDENDRKNKVVFHTLRHTFASHLAINGTPIFTIQRLMNHKDIKMTLRYSKLSPDSGRNEVNYLNF